MLYNAAIAVAGANKAFLVINCVMTWVLSISTTEYGWGDCTYSTKSFQPSNHHIFLTYFPEWDILPDTLTLSMYFLIQLKHFKNISFLKYQTFRALVVMFHNALLKSIGSVKRKIFNINDLFGIKMLTRLRSDFCHIHEHNFKHGIKYTLNSLYSCSIKAENT